MDGYLIGQTFYGYLAVAEWWQNINTFIANAGVFGEVYFKTCYAHICGLVQLGARLFRLCCRGISVFLRTDKLNPFPALLAIPLLVLLIAVLVLALVYYLPPLQPNTATLPFFLSFAVQLLMFLSCGFPASMFNGTTFVNTHFICNPVENLIETIDIIITGNGVFRQRIFFERCNNPVVVLGSIIVLTEPKKPSWTLYTARKVIEVNSLGKTTPAGPWLKQLWLMI